MRLKEGVWMSSLEEEVNRVREVMIPAVSFLNRWKYNAPLKLCTENLFSAIKLVPALRTNTCVTLNVSFTSTMIPVCYL